MKTLSKLLWGIGLLYSASAFAQTVPYPSIPIRGSVSGISISATIEAKVSSETVGSATVREDYTYRMDINQDNPSTPEDEGASINDIVDFYSNGKKADESITFDGDAQTQNLTFPEDTPTPENTPTDTPKPPSPTPTDTPKPPSPTPTRTDTPKPTITDTPYPTDTPKPDPTATETETYSPTPTDTPKPPTYTPTDTPKPTETDTPPPSYTPTDTPKPSPTETPTPEYNTDLNQDGITDEKDLILLLNDWKTAENRVNKLFLIQNKWYR